MQPKRFASKWNWTSKVLHTQPLVAQISDNCSNQLAGYWNYLLLVTDRKQIDPLVTEPWAGTPQ